MGMRIRVEILWDACKAEKLRLPNVYAPHGANTKHGSSKFLENGQPEWMEPNT
jgi:hypothetical protein